MRSIKELIKIVKENNLDGLIEKYGKPYVLSENKNLYEDIQLKKFGTDKFVLNYLYDYSENHIEANKYDTVKQIWKEVVFRVVDRQNEILYVELANNHASFEGRKIRLS